MNMDTLIRSRGNQGMQGLMKWIDAKIQKEQCRWNID